MTTSPPRHGSGTASACRHGAAPPPRQILPSDAVACVRSIRCRRPCAVRHRPYGCYGAVVSVNRGSGSPLAPQRHPSLTVWCVQELGEHRSRCSASFPCLCKNALLSLCSYSLLQNPHVRSKHVFFFAFRSWTSILLPQTIVRLCSTSIFHVVQATRFLLRQTVQHLASYGCSFSFLSLA